MIEGKGGYMKVEVWTGTGGSTREPGGTCAWFWGLEFNAQTGHANITDVKS
jgi:hypothetical protein